VLELSLGTRRSESPVSGGRSNLSTEIKNFLLREGRAVVTREIKKGSVEKESKGTFHLT